MSMGNYITIYIIVYICLFSNYANNYYHCNLINQLII